MALFFSLTICTMVMISKITPEIIDKINAKLLPSAEPLAAAANRIIMPIKNKTILTMEIPKRMVLFFIIYLRVPIS